MFKNSQVGCSSKSSSHGIGKKSSIFIAMATMCVCVESHESIYTYIHDTLHIM